MAGWTRTATWSPPGAGHRVGHRQQLDHVAQAGGHGDVVGGDAGDALPVDVARPDVDAEGDAGDDGGLGRGVEALDVGGGVALGVAQGLGLGQGVGEGVAPLGHAGEDEVGRPVDDADDPADAVAGEGLPQRAHEGDGPADGGLEEEVDARLHRRVEQLGPVGGEQLLVGGDDRLARLQGGEDEGAGRLDAADDLDDQVDVGVGDDAGGVVGEHAGGEGRPAGDG